MTYRGQNDYEKDFIRYYDRIACRHDRREVWADAMYMMAASLANPLSPKDDIFNKREERYLSTIQKYSKDEQEIFPKLLAYVTMALAENPGQDFLGNLFMSLGLGGNRGQYFTPYNISELMSELSFEDAKIKQVIEQHGFASISDMCCGAGGMLIAFANTCTEHGIDYQEHVIFVAQDIDPVVSYMCYIQLSLLGCPGYVIIGDSLLDPVTGDVLFPKTNNDIWYTFMYRFKLMTICNNRRNAEWKMFVKDYILGTITLTEQECYCDIYELFLHIAEHFGITVPKKSVFNSNKIHVSKAVKDKVFEYYSDNSDKNHDEIMELWNKCGPKTCIETNATYSAAVEDEFIYCMRMS